MQTGTPFIRPETKPKLHEVICNHLCREGMQDTAEMLMRVGTLMDTSLCLFFYSVTFGVKKQTFGAQNCTNQTKDMASFEFFSMRN